MKNNLLELDLQLFAEEVEGVGVEEPTTAESEEETSEEETVEEGETEDGNAEPEQTPEENARYAAIRRRAEEDAKRRYDAEMGQLNQQIAAMCQGTTHPVTGKPIMNVREYIDALSTQQRMERENELKEKGIDPSVIDKMIAENPVVMQARQVLEQNRMAEATNALQRDMAELAKIDPSIKSVDDLAALPSFPRMLESVARGESLVDAYKMCNFDAFMQHTNDAARQQAINQMRGKSHLPSQTQGVATENDDDVEVPPEIMARFKADGKTEKQIKELYKRVPH